MNPPAAAIERLARTGTTMGIAILVMGVLAIVAPFIAGTAVVVVVAVALIAAGIANLLFAFRAESLGRGLLTGLFGGVAVLAGVGMLLRPGLGLASLTLLLIAYFLLDGLFGIVAAIRLKPTAGWGWGLVGGLVSVLLAVLIGRQWPVSGLWAVGVLVGVGLIFRGLSLIMLGGIGARVADRVADLDRSGA